MKLLLVSETDPLGEFLEYHLLPLGIEVLHYHNPLKAMDNLKEINPDYTLVSALDFPRHWKLLLRSLRELKDKDAGVFILLASEDLPVEEADKAIFLESNAIFKESPVSREAMSHLMDLLKRYKNPADNRRNQRFVPGEKDYIRFIFTHPDNLEVITGRVQDLTTFGISFLPDSPASTSTLPVDMLIPSCSIKLGETILRSDCRIIRNSKIMAFRFEKPPAEFQAAVSRYIEDSPLRRMAQPL